MKKASIILGALIATIALAVIACNSSQKKSANHEGLVVPVIPPLALISNP
jgi:hypothetical protein